jgi:hypothetical protein
VEKSDLMGRKGIVEVDSVETDAAEYGDAVVGFGFGLRVDGDVEGDGVARRIHHDREKKNHDDLYTSKKSISKSK